MKKTAEGQPKQAILAALGTEFYVKTVIVVDEDVDIFNLSDVMWAVITRTRAEQDIIYIGGGNTKSMLAVWEEWGLSNLLRVAYENGTILCGVSAGAICWFNKGVTDSWRDELKVMDCLGIINDNAWICISSS